MTDDITHELAETLKELRQLYDSRQHLGPSMVRVDAVLDRYEDACKTQEPVITKVEVIADEVREYVNWKPYNKITTSLQDDGKTLKVFVTQNTEEPKMTDMCGGNTPIVPEETIDEWESLGLIYDELVYTRDKTLYNKAEKEVSKQWATALSNFIDKLGGDSPALWEWKGKTPTPEKVVECLQELFDFHTQIATDGELDECCRILEINGYFEHRDMLLKYRRPQPTLKSQALKDLETVRKNSDIIPEILETIEKALKSIPEDSSV